MQIQIAFLFENKRKQTKSIMNLLTCYKVRCLEAKFHQQERATLKLHHILPDPISTYSHSILVQPV